MGYTEEWSTKCEKAPGITKSQMHKRQKCYGL